MFILKNKKGSIIHATEREKIFKDICLKLENKKDFIIEVYRNDELIDKGSIEDIFNEKYKK